MENPVSESLREYKRVTAGEIPVALEVAGHRLDARIEDISMSGLRVAVRDAPKLELGQSVTATFRLEGVDDELCRPATLAWQTDHEMGLRLSSRLPVKAALALRKLANNTQSV